MRCAVSADSMGLHRVENPSHTSPAVSLHLYSPPFETCQSFDERTGKARTVKMVFWSKHGSPVSSADVNASTDSRQQVCVSAVLTIKQTSSTDRHHSLYKRATLFSTITLIFLDRS